MTSKLDSHLKMFEPFIKAIVELFHPFVEAAVHDLSQGQLVAIYHNLSQRKIGDASPLQELNIPTDSFPDYFPPYYKRNWDGRFLKCTSITIRNLKGKAIGLICFNVDASFAQDTYILLEQFLKIPLQAQNPIEMFSSQNEESIVSLIQSYVQEHHLSLNHLNKKQKQDLVQFLYHKGAFNLKNAVPSIAQYLHISRASVYNYLKRMGE